MMKRYSNYVAIGDSFTEGVGDENANYPNGVRGWADRVAEQLAYSNPDFKYANLAIRGSLLPQIINEQVDAALNLRPDLVTIYGGGNDLLRFRVDIDNLVNELEASIVKFVNIGATVVVWTSVDPRGNGMFSILRGRCAIYNELIRDMVSKYPQLLCLDFWKLRIYDNSLLWQSDKLHMSSLGHELMAFQVLDLLGVKHNINCSSIPPAPKLNHITKIRTEIKWYKDFLCPWLGRRILGKSSGDNIKPKYPEWTSMKTA